MYVYGGKNSLGLVHSVEKYNPELNMWLVIKTNFESSIGMAMCLRGASCTSGTDDENIVIVGGKNQDDEESSSVSLASSKSPQIGVGGLASMIEKRAFAAVVML